MTDHGTMTVEEKLTFLNQAGVFSDAGKEFLLSLATALQGLKARPQQTIFRKGEPGDAMYIITRGSVRIHDGTHVLSRLEPGNIFGEYSLIDEGPRSASVTAEEECHLLRLSRSDFESLDRQPVILWDVTSVEERIP